jgi:hypothetical protein
MSEEDWTKIEQLFLIILCEQGLSDAQIAIQIGRLESSVRNLINRKGYDANYSAWNTSHHWTFDTWVEWQWRLNPLTSNSELAKKYLHYKKAYGTQFPQVEYSMNIDLTGQRSIGSQPDSLLKRGIKKIFGMDKENRIRSIPNVALPLELRIIADKGMPLLFSASQLEVSEVFIERLLREHGLLSTYESNYIEYLIAEAERIKKKNGWDFSPFREEESLTFEFKASFRTPYPDYPEAKVDSKGQKYFEVGREKLKSTKDVQKFIEEQCLKTIVAFLNTKGGTLMVGVHERNQKKTIVGIKRELFESNDHYERHINQQIQNRIGKRFLSDNISINFLKHEENELCIIKCDEYIPLGNDLPALLDGEKCYRRTGPRTDLLNPVEFAKFSVERVNSITSEN